MLQNNPQIKSLIDRLWDRLWSGGISNPLSAIEQITYLIFMKRLDDMDLKEEKDADFTGEKFNSRFSGTIKLPGIDKEVERRTLRWSYIKQLNPEDMLVHVQTKVFPFLKQLNGGTSPFTKHMANAVFIIAKPSLISEAIGIIDEIFKEIEKDASVGGQAFQDIQGDVYEMLLGEIASAGKNGQFRTPRHIIKLMAELADPQLGNKIADPACGTGGFLLGAYQYILTTLVRAKDPSKLIKDEDGFERGAISAVLTEDVKKILDSSFFGYDIDVTMVRLGLMNLMMHGIQNPQIDYKDTLSKSYNENGIYDIIMANPPFTGSIDKGDINESMTLPTTKTELLFVERMFRMLKMGGTAAVIVPQGVLFGSGKAFVQLRKLIIEMAELKAVITMPSGVFKPYAGVATAILIFTKGGETKKVWFYEMKRDGYSLDDKRQKLENQSDLQDIIESYKIRNKTDFTDRKGKCFFIPKTEIEENNYDLSLSKYKEEDYIEQKYDPPSEILDKLTTIENEITSGIEELKGLAE